MFVFLGLVLVLTDVGHQALQPEAIQSEAAQGAVSIRYADSVEYVFSDAERMRIETLLMDAYAIAKADFPDLPDQIAVRIDPINRPAVDALGGVSGRAERPGEAVLELSVTYPGGVLAAAENKLQSIALHEFHHLAHGWTIEDNRFGPGIDIATVIEGLAQMYQETYFGRDTTYADLDEATFTAWAEEIRALPWNADYGQWMFSHPDGREAIGYRTGIELVRRAMARSGLDIIAISAMSPNEIWEMAGFEPED